MLRKILAASLAVFIFTAVSGVNVFARAFDGENEKNTATVKEEKKIEKKDFSKNFKIKNDSANDLEKADYSRAEYERQKAQGKKFSTTTKVLIGVGVAAAVIGIVVFAASSDKIRTF